MRTLLWSPAGMRTEADKPVSCQAVLPTVFHAIGAPPPTVSSSKAGWPVSDRVSAENCANLAAAQEALKVMMPEHVPAQLSKASLEGPLSKLPDMCAKLLGAVGPRMGEAAEPAAHGSQKLAPSELCSPIWHGVQASGPVAPGSGL